MKLSLLHGNARHHVQIPNFILTRVLPFVFIIPIFSLIIWLFNHLRSTQSSCYGSYTLIIDKPVSLAIINENGFHLALKWFTVIKMF